jgi:homoserine kinase
VIHQPVRGAAFPLAELIDAAYSKGAHGAFLSGAGPTVLALTGGHGSDVDADTMVTFLAVEVADAMLEAAKREGAQLTSARCRDRVGSVVHADAARAGR